MPSRLAASESTFSEMPHVPLVLLCVALLVVAAALLALQKQHGRIHKIRKKFDALAGEEHRMFSFLHDLGFAIENEPSPSVLSRIIVEGVGNVVAARGGAIYFISSENEHLSPSHISDDCPPLIEVPQEIRQKAQQDPRALSSYLRLSRVPLDEGVLGHCLTLGEPLHVRDLQNHAAFAGAQFPQEERISALLAPLRHAHRDLGVLAVARRHCDGGFTANDFEVFRTAAEQSSFALGNARIHREANEKHAIESELQNAREVQRILLPQADPVIGG
jgi:sigma-B regulation protein RsbU (phosphoserine phosphatase)